MSHEDPHAEVRAALLQLQSAINRTLRHDRDVVIAVETHDVTCIEDQSTAYVRTLAIVVTTQKVIE